MSLQKRIQDCIARHPDWDDRRIASAIRGGNRYLVATVREGKPWPESGDPTPAAGTINMAQVRRRYDVSKAILEALAALPKGELIIERELCLRTAGKDAARFRRTVENTPELHPHRVKLKLDPNSNEGSWYWGRREDAAEAARLRDE